MKKKNHSFHSLLSQKLILIKVHSHSIDRFIKILNSILTSGFHFLANSSLSATLFSAQQVDMFLPPATQKPKDLDLYLNILFTEPLFLPKWQQRETSEILSQYSIVGSTVSLWSVRWTLDQAVWFSSPHWPCMVTMLCSWARHFTLTVPLHPGVYI